MKAAIDIIEMVEVVCSSKTLFKRQMADQIWSFGCSYWTFFLGPPLPSPKNLVVPTICPQSASYLKTSALMNLGQELILETG